MRSLVPIVLSMLWLLPMSACGPDGSVIYDTDPFLVIEADFSPKDRQRFLQASDRFAVSQSYKIAINEFGDGTFSVLIHDSPPASLNIAAMNGIKRGTISIDAMSRGPPTGDQKAAIQSYLAAVRPYIANPRPVTM